MSSVNNESNSNVNELKNIYIKTTLIKDVYLSPVELNKNINKTILKKLKEKYENKCLSIGYVKKNSINIISRTIGMIGTTNFKGYVKVSVKFSVDICNPVKDNIITCTVKNINKLGLLAENGPLSVIIVKEYHDDIEVFNDIDIDDVIKVRVIGKKYKLNGKEISVMGTIII